MFQDVWNAQPASSPQREPRNAHRVPKECTRTKDVKANASLAQKVLTPAVRVQSPQTNASQFAATDLTVHQVLYHALSVQETRSRERLQWTDLKNALNARMVNSHSNPVHKTLKNAERNANLELIQTLDWHLAHHAR